MVTSTRKKLPFAPRRRVVEEEDEEDQAQLDSFSDDSGLSDYDEEEDEEAVSDESDEEDGDDNEEEVQESASSAPSATAPVDRTNTSGTATSEGNLKKLPSVVENGTREHDIMVNGLPEDELDGEEVDFEDMVPEVEEEAKEATPVEQTQPRTQHNKETSSERRKREHEMYKARRDADPAFVPNRGAFFMHDSRDGGNNFRFSGRGGRGGMQARFQQKYDYTHGREMRSKVLKLTFASRDAPQPTPPTDNKWKHDMHEETLNSEKQHNNLSLNNQSRGGRYVYPKPNSTQLKGTVQMIVNLPGMEKPITFTEFPLRSHNRLPPHRPPLRRDKPVRIALPTHPIRYIYPTQQRSFVFIPRNMRPGFVPPFPNKFAGKPFAPNNLHHQHGKIGTPYSAGSAHQSRRSSFSKLQDGGESGYAQDGAAAQPTHDYSVADSGDERSKPVVKLPTVTPQSAAPATAPSSETDETKRTPTTKVPPTNPYPTPPAQPLQEVRGTPTIPMHQPRPQKAVSILDIENPAIPYAYPPPQMAMPYQTHSRNASYQSTGAPNLEAAVHAPPFQPGYAMPPPYFYPPQYMPAFIPPMGMDPNMMQPMFVPPPPPPYMPAPVPVSTSQAPAGASGVVAQESNGTVYFYDQSQYYAMAGYQNGGMMPVTPGPDGTAQINTGDGNQEAAQSTPEQVVASSTMNPAAVSYYYPSQPVYYQ